MRPTKTGDDRMNFVPPRTLVACLLLCAFAGCTGDDLELDVAGGTGPDRFEAIRRRLPIAIRPGPDGYAGIPGYCDTAHCAPASFIELVYYGCALHVWPRSINDAPNYCDRGRIVAEIGVCAANILLEIIESPSAREVTLVSPQGLNPGVVTVPPQDAESNAELARLAHERAAIALSVSAAIFDAADCTDAALASTDPETGFRYVERLAYFFREAQEAAHQAAQHMTLSSAAVSDSAYSRLADRAAASAFTTADFASRTAAAHLLIGGDLGLPALAGVSEEGFYTRSALSGEAQRAVRWIRAAAIDPDLVRDSSAIAPTTDQLVAGGGPVSAAGSIRFRLGLMQSQARLRDATSPDAVYTMLGVTRQGFSEAREHLREELRAFDRSRAARVSPERLPDGSTTEDHGIVLYAATRTPPRQLLTSWWAAVLRHDPTPNPVLTTYNDFTAPPPWLMTPSGFYLPSGDSWGEESAGTGSPPHVVGRRSLVSVVDEAHRRGGTILARLCPGGACNPAFGDAPTTFARAIADLAPSPELAATSAGTPSPTPTYETAPYIGRSRACWWGRSDTNHRFDVRIEIAAPITSELLVVRGRDGLTCAVEGTLEGVECDVALFQSLLPNTNPWRNPVGGPRWVRVNDEPISQRPAPNTASLFVVQRRPGFTGAPMPGQYRELTGFVLPRPAVPHRGYHYCIGAVIAPRQEEEAARLVQPSPSAPHRPAESCAGLPSDLRIPLENELTSDARPRESSWAHYLELARRASAEADALGEDLIRTGLEMDLRSEAAASDIERLCGVRINLTSIARELDGGPPPVAPGPPPCAVPYAREGDRCVLDPVLHAATRAARDEDMARLAECIGADVVPWATLGDNELCIWDLDPDSPGGVCARRDGVDPPARDMPCPFLSDGAGGCAHGATPPGVTAFAVSERIGLFRMPAEPAPPPPDPTEAPCESLARARAGVANLDDAGRVIGFLSMLNVQQHARQLSWEALVGDYSAVRYAGSIVFRTGSVTAGPSEAWPMGTPMPARGLCPSGFSVADPSGYTGPLACLGNVAASSREARARTNDLLARAVMAARVFTGQGLRGLVFPYYPNNHAWRYEASNDQIDYAPLYVAPGSPPAFCSSSGEFVVDHHPSDPDGPYTVDVPTLGSRVCVIGGSPQTCPPGAAPAAPAGGEWSRCPYHLANCRYFDDQFDCDDLTFTDRDMPMVLRAADSGLDVPGAERNAATLWNGDLWRRFFYGSEYGARSSVLPLAGLTRYFDDWSFDCLQAEYEDCVRERPQARLMSRGNRAFIGEHGSPGLTHTDFMNGMELLCLAAAQGLPVTETNCAEPPEVVDMSDAYRLAGYMECRANELDSFGAGSIVRDLPRRVVTALRRDAHGTYGTGSGELDSQISEVRAALIDLTTIRTASANDMRALAARIRSLRSAVARHGRAREIDDLVTAGQIMDRVTSCITAAASIGTTDVGGIAGRAAAATATCTNAVGQTILAFAISRLRQADIDDAIIDEFARFDAEMSGFAQRTSDRAASVRAALERLDGALTRVRVTQSQARRALARALLLEDGGVQAHFAVDTVYRARYSTALARYRRSHQRAVRAAYIARIALEQRLGMPLADIGEDLFSDEPPSRWVDTICTLPSIDYDRVRSSAPPETGGRDEDGVLIVPDGYAGTFVGDYVRRLEDVFESYSFVHPFRDGGDTAVISLRDDVLGTRAECEVPSPNLLVNGGRLDVFQGFGREGWRIDGCDPSAVTEPGIVNRQCVSVDPIEAIAGTGDVPEGIADLSRVGVAQPYRLRFGESLASTAEARLEQAVDVGEGRYRVSWFARGEPTLAAFAFAVWDASDALRRTGMIFDEPVRHSATWRRYWFYFDVAATETVRVVAGHGTSPPTPISFDVAGVMLEDVTGAVRGDPDALITIPRGDESISTRNGLWAAPPPFSESGDLGLTTARTCPDRDGRWFRREAFGQLRCVRICPDGYDGSCPPEWAEQRCYRDTTIDIDADTLQHRLLAADAGFASGNYNYRIESIAVNFVGTGLRDCTSGGDTSGCFASGNLSYSLLHQGDFLVRNARGASYIAPIFSGRIESARALAAERYLTNPLSGADRALVEAYVRDEFQGRPMAGTLVLRVWDDPRFAFDRLEDVQLLLNYRYWQHQR